MYRSTFGVKFNHPRTHIYLNFGTKMTLLRISIITFLVACLPTFLSLGNADVLSSDVVIDDYHANPKDFIKSQDTASEKREDPKPTIVATCDKQTCNDSG